MHHSERREIAGLLLLTLALSLFCLPVVQSLAAIPDHQRLSVGEPMLQGLHFPRQVLENINVQVDAGPRDLLEINGGRLAGSSFGLVNGYPVARQPGKFDLQLRLFGLIPIRKVAVDVVPETRVWPGGHSIGVLLHGQGVMVVGYAAVTGHDGEKHYPAKEAGMRVGDIILSVGKEVVRSDQHVTQLVNDCNGNPVTVKIKRGQTELELAIEPALCAETGHYRIGLLIRDGAAGVGTLSFYDGSKVFGALGHIIIDAETNREIDISQGRVVKALVQGIQQGKRGRPGEKIGLFVEAQELSGKIDKNTPFGIFGQLDSLPGRNYYPEPIPVAFAGQVQSGPAEILTVIKGDTVEKFGIVIEKVMPQRAPNGKGLVIHITDPRLLAATGGIVQGMSGSPIIQNGRLIGAVTHVFVNDPTRGYGVLAEWMLMEAGVWKSQRAGSDSRSLHVCQSYASPSAFLLGAG